MWTLAVSLKKLEVGKKEASEMNAGSCLNNPLESVVTKVWIERINIKMTLIT